MRKALLGVFLAIFLCISASTTYAAGNQMKVDGVAIKSDAKLEVKNKQTMVPLRVISENLGAAVNWSNSKVILSKGDMKITLNLNSLTAEKKGQKVQLAVKPYMKNKRIFVPLRFIAETFGCEVKYSNSTVNIDTEPLVIDGVEVEALQHEYHMTMGGVVQQVNGNAYNEAVYNIFVKNIGKKVEAPANYSWRFDLDTPGSYYKNAQYDFLDQKGDSLVRYDVYSLVDSFPAELLKGLPKVLVHDATNNEWYLFSDTARESIYQLIDTASRNGLLKVISNTVV